MCAPSSTPAAVPDAPAPLRPNGARIASLDYIRGVAVLGILAANIGAFGQPQLTSIWPLASLAQEGPASSWLWLAQFVLIDGKMRGLFTLLFGAGMVLFVERARSRGAGIGLQARRLGWLLVFGLAHFFLLWRGDILTAYALCGLLVLPLVSWDAVRLLTMGLTVYLFGAIWETYAYGAPFLASAGPDALEVLHAQTAAYLEGEHADALIEAGLARSGDYVGFVHHAFAQHAWEWWNGVAGGWLETAPLIMTGMGLHRAGLFDGGIDPRVQRRWGWIALAAGLALNIPLGLWAMARGLNFQAVMFVEVGLSSLTRLPLVLGLAALLALHGGQASGWLHRRLSAAGRMAFTNYLGTSLAMLAVFHGWGLGLFGLLDRPRLYVVVPAAWAVMLLASPWWLARFRYGPLEWLWRCLTYARVFPLRR